MVLHLILIKCVIEINLDTISLLFILNISILYMSKKTFIISNISGGGSVKYINDIMNRYSNICIIRNKTELYKHQYSSTDLLLVQQLFFTDITPIDLIELKNTYSLKIVISIHDFCWFHDLKYESIYLHNIIVLDSVKNLFELANYVIYPSYFVKNIYESYIPKHSYIIQPHNDITINYNTKCIPPIQNTIIVGVPTAFSDYKGKENITTLMKYTNYKNYKIEFRIVGFNCPHYNETNYYEFYNKVHCLLHLNKWGETYCYTLSKSINSGLPILYNNIGAFKERIPYAEHYFKVIEKEEEYYNIDKLTKNFEIMLDYIIENNGKYNKFYNNNTIQYHDFYDFLFESRIPVTILLTSTVNINDNKICMYQKNPTDRVKTYLKSIQNWLKYTKFTIVLVENSGYKFDELKELKDQYNYKFEHISYDEKKNSKLYLNNSKGISELYAINHAYNESKYLKKTFFIIKITCRFLYLN